MGKSSFLNALLGKSVLITDVLECTATVTFLHNAEESSQAPDRVRVIYSNGQEKWEPIGRLTSLTAAHDGSVAEEIEQVHVYVDHEIIPPRVTVVDSPGLNGLKEHHKAITYRQMAISHAAVFMFAGDRGIVSEKELEALERLFTYAGHVLIVVNKWDQVGEDEDIKARVKKRILDGIQKAQAAVDNRLGRKGDLAIDNVYFVSSKNVLEAARSGQRSIGKDLYDYRAMRSALNEAISEDSRTRHLKLQPLKVMRELSENALGRIKEELDALNTLKPDEEIQQEREKRRELMERVKDTGEQIKRAAEADASFSVEACEKLIESEVPLLQTTLKEKVRSATEDRLRSQEFQREIQGELKAQINTRISKKIGDLFTAMGGNFLRRLLAQDKVADVSSAYCRVDPITIDMSRFEIDRSRDDLNFETRYAKVDRERSELEAKRKVEEGLVADGNKAESEKTAALQTRDALVKDRQALGARPAAKEWYEPKEYWVDEYRGGLGILDWWFGPKRVKKTSYTKRRDDSAGQRWQSSYDDYTAKIAPLDRTIANCDQRILAKAKAMDQIEGLKRQISEKERELTRLRDERTAADKRRKTERLERLKVATINSWKKEIVESLTRVRSGLNHQAANIIGKIFDELERRQEEREREFHKQLDEEEQRRNAQDSELNRERTRCLKAKKEVSEVSEQIKVHLANLGG